jgi:L-threonylcarbamoyladenylate synthase
MHQTIIKKINPQNPDPEIIAKAASVIRQGGVIGFPTRCLYGLGADALNPDAVERIIKIKQRPQDNPILILVDSKRQLGMLVNEVPPTADVLITAFWPGRVTLVFEARKTVSEKLTAQTGKIGVRIPGHPVAAALVKQVKGPITGTSANLSGQAGVCRVRNLDPAVAENLDCVLDAGTLMGGIGSTVVDVTVDPPRILREGTVTASQIRGSLARI